jgi:hypothetical protein
MTAEIGGRSCTVAGCDRAHYGRELCRAHHQRWRRTGDPGPAEIHHQVRGTCAVAGCGRPHEAKGLCRTHYSRSRRTGNIHPTTPANPRPCGVSGCQQRHYARGLCQTHYQRWKQTGGEPLGLDITECAQLYRDGASAAGLGRLYGHTPHTILTALRAAGVPIRPPGRRHRHRTA